MSSTARRALALESGPQRVSGPSGPLTYQGPQGPRGARAPSISDPNLGLLGPYLSPLRIPEKKSSLFECFLLLSLIRLVQERQFGIFNFKAEISFYKSLKIFISMMRMRREG